MQHQITSPGPLHRSDGTLSEPGWATDLLLDYDRRRIRASRMRIKEWDYYCVLGETHGVSFTVADNGYMGFVATTVFDFEAPAERSLSRMTPFPLGRFGMPPGSRSGDVQFRRKGFRLRFRREAGRRILEADIPSFPGGGLSGEIELIQDGGMDTLVVATPFAKNRKAFYYNQKVNCMPATGALQWGSRALSFSPADSFGVLDWGRGVWTYANTWYWGSASGRVSGEPFGFNIGYGFGDTSAASENMLFYRGIAHKLEEVAFHIPEPDFLKPWTFTSSDGRFEMTFQPILDRFSDSNVGVIRSWQHQVFGRFSGIAVLDDGTRLEIRDLLGFAEKVKNRW